MVHPLILPGVLLATGIAALVRDHKNLANAQGAGGAPPPLASLLETVRAADNAVVSRFKTDVAAVLLQALKGAALVSEPVEGEQGPRMLYKIVPSTSPTDTSANAAALAAQAEGFIVLASTVLVDLSHQGKKDTYLLFCRPADRKLANPSGHLALLLDAPDPAPRPREAAVVTPPPAAEVVAGAVAPNPTPAPAPASAQTPAPVDLAPAPPAEPVKEAAPSAPERAKKAKAALSKTVKAQKPKVAKTAKAAKDEAVKTAGQKPAQSSEPSSHQHLNGKSVLVSSDPPAPADEVSA